MICQRLAKGPEAGSFSVPPRQLSRSVGCDIDRSEDAIPRHAWHPRIFKDRERFSGKLQRLQGERPCPYAWPIGGGLLVGAALGLLLGLALRARLRRDHAVAWDELVYVGTVALGYGLARVTGTSAFVVAFAAGATLLLPMPIGPESGDGLRARLHAFGGRCERLVEASAVLAVGVALHSVPFTLPVLLFALLLLVVVRPVSVLLVVRERSIPRRQRRLVAWFGIRGVGSLFYLVFALHSGVSDPLATTLIAATLWCVALSIVLHGLSATPLMAAHHLRQRREARR